jgi:hypothetical protein
MPCQLMDVCTSSLTSRCLSDKTCAWPYLTACHSRCCDLCYLHRVTPLSTQHIRSHMLPRQTHNLCFSSHSLTRSSLPVSRLHMLPVYLHDTVSTLCARATARRHSAACAPAVGSHKAHPRTQPKFTWRMHLSTTPCTFADVGNAVVADSIIANVPLTPYLCRPSMCVACCEQFYEKWFEMTVIQKKEYADFSL